jgi:hypothetical protein
LNTNTLHEPRRRASGNIEAFAARLPPNLQDAVVPPVLFEDPKDLGAQSLVPARTIRLQLRVNV